MPRRESTEERAQTKVALEVYLARLEELAQKAPRMPLTGKLLVDEDELASLVEELRRSIPEEIQQARRLQRERERILEEARTEAEALVKEARSRIDRLAKDSVVLTEAERRAREILKEAEVRAEELKSRGLQYLDEVLLRVEGQLRRVADTLERNRLELQPSRRDEARKTGS